MVALASTLAACDGGTAQPGHPSDREDSPAPYQAEVEEGLGAAIAILVDTSGSMREEAPGDSRPKAAVAREALEAMFDATEALVAKRPEFRREGRHLQFLERCLDRDADPHLQSSGRARRAGPAAEARQAARPLARPCARRDPTCIAPACFASISWSSPTARIRRVAARTSVAREIFQKSEHGVQIYFVAFDIGADRFSFLKDVQGDVIGANSGPELRKALDEIYQGRILAEASTLGEREPESR